MAAELDRIAAELDGIAGLDRIAAELNRTPAERVQVELTPARQVSWRRAAAGRSPRRPRCRRQPCRTGVVTP
jgi:hypothetical protein